MIGLGILSSLIALVAFGIPMVYGMIRCIKYLFGQPSQVTIADAYTQQYDSVLDVSETHAFVKPNIKKYNYAEIISMGVSPLMGIIVSFFFMEMNIPFDPLHAISAITFIAIGYISYWASRGFKKDLPLSINLLLPYGILIGILCYIFLFLHFLSITTLLAVALASIIAFPLLAPLPATFFAFRQFQIQQAYVKEAIKRQEDSENYIDKWTAFLAWNNSTNPFALIACILIILGALFLIGQPLDGFWQAFRGSHGFLFSIKDLNI